MPLNASARPVRAKPSRAVFRGFEALNMLLWTLTAALTAFCFENNRVDWFLLLGWTMSFPFSAVADEHALLIRYDPGFRMLFGRTPLMIPFAFGWFFSLPLILLRHSGAMAELSVPMQAAAVFAGFTVFGCAVETLSTTRGLYRYRWPAGWKIAGTPWPVFLIDGAVHAFTYLIYGAAPQLTDGLGWAAALGVSVALYNGMFIAFAAFNWLLITRLLGIRPVPETVPAVVR